ncbi:unnamed protein product [Zymoseptoria tritici ST99CH_1A5]|uniref:Conidiation-specific protein 8 n=3 Tax=Zymoseptoria tritici TaxID=1047171 RepID=A0A1X7RYG9_ZYMT9|nr:unnamed protein product [Zymoseptoria tritici ST99CH_3D7]SMR55062.1 unnamed protein product [Zymoseptoria tritici ST99CH_1E4]SMR57449.1 unnamed protein product [Zymoseptoria tritici ST99CH_3D1]SMY25888.1 unnamed protein product [Zymoseptoria tritici ST99CH_1A5]
MSSPVTDQKNRRSSSSASRKGGLAGFQEFKRESPAANARRASIKDQNTAPSGVISNLWNSTMKGHEKK